MSKERTMSIPEAGAEFYGSGKNGSYELADQGLIPYLQIGRRKVVPREAMEKRYAEVCAEAASRKTAA